MLRQAEEGVGGRKDSQSGATLLYLCSSYFEQLCDSGLKCSAQKELAQC
jgi:hypothetical protein